MTNRTAKRPAIEGLDDRQILGMVKVLSEHLLDYVREWDRRQTAKGTPE